MFAPEAVRRLLQRSKPMQDTASEFFPFRIVKKLPGEIEQLRPLRIVVRGCADIRRLVPGKVNSLRGVRFQGRDIRKNRTLPSLTTVRIEFLFDQSISFQPRVRVPVAV